ncbi:ROK family transcriptional regulator [Paenibacillus sp. EKM212P]|uniref:ROK family transcriptional regulator n=1 Tax=Paenibacillus sp. EKM212P TaxID=1683680 RepID=UPI0013E9AE9C|nr:ROK family transcriptional regulator [Paenibacillus sp. EKM212P]KAF6577155.1 ROK family transcriptional regulator [Paenibacillus sp. EKM212P]
MNVTGDQALVKKLNKSIVLERIRLHAPLSRAQLSSQTGLNKATVSNLVAELITDGLVYETGLGESSGGRKPLMLLFNSRAGFVLGIEVSVQYIKGALTDLSGTIETELTLSLNQHDPAFVMEQIRKLVQELMQATPPSPHGIVGIGLGVPGMVDETGTVLFAPNLGWEEVPLRQQLEAELCLPVVVDNEANVGAQGELYYGMDGDHRQQVRDLVYISAGSGIGAGIIIDGKPYQGAWGYAGETGHMTIDWNGRLCSCGSRGCWELYASEKAYSASTLKLPAHNTAELLPFAQQGEASTLSVLDDIGRYLGVGITNIVNSLNPGMLIIGGPLAEARPWLEQSMRDVIDERALPYHRRQLQIRFSTLGSRSTMLGAAYAATAPFLGRVRVSL